MGIAYAMAPPGGAAGGGGDISFIIMMVVLFAIFYFLMIRPQQKKQKELRDMIANLTHGDIVITSGGLIGKITGLTESEITLEVADKVRVKVLRNFVSAVKQKAS